MIFFLFFSVCQQLFLTKSVLSLYMYVKNPVREPFTLFL